MSNVFVPHQCNVCLLLHLSHEVNGESIGPFVPKDSLSPCADCKLTLYCSQKHKDLDWKMHSDLCTNLKSIRERFKVNHPYRISGPPTDAFTFERATFQVKYLLRTALKRPLKFFEEDQTSFPPHCAVCYSLEEIKPCKQCWSVGYCSGAHAIEHHPKHVKICGVLQVYHTRFNAAKLPAPGTIVSVVHKAVPDFMNKDLIAAFPLATQIPLPKCPTESLNAFKLYSSAASFSCMGTICFTLFHCDMIQYAYESNKFVMYIVGANEEHDLWFRDIHTKFFFLHFPDIHCLEIYFFGRAVSSTEPRSHSFTFAGITRNVTYLGFRGRLETFNKKYNIKPAIIAGFNCGFTNVTPKETFMTGTDEQGDDDGPIRSDWVDTLSDIVQTYHTPIIITSYSSLEAEYDFDAMSNAAKTDRLEAKLDHLFEITPNPYRDFRPLRNWQAIHGNEIYYRNGYVQAVISTLKN